MNIDEIVEVDPEIVAGFQRRVRYFKIDSNTLEGVKVKMFLGHVRLGTVEDISFSVQLNDQGGLDVPLALDGKRDLVVDYEHSATNTAGFIYCRYEGNEVPSVCWNVMGFFDANKDKLFERAHAAIYKQD